MLIDARVVYYVIYEIVLRDKSVACGCMSLRDNLMLCLCCILFSISAVSQFARMPV